MTHHPNIQRQPGALLTCRDEESRIIARAVRRPICRDGWSPLGACRKGHPAPYLPGLSSSVARAIRRPICRDSLCPYAPQGPSGALSAGTATPRASGPAWVVSQGPSGALSAGTTYTVRATHTSTTSRKGHPAPYLPGPARALPTGRKGHPAPYLPGPIGGAHVPLDAFLVARAIRRPICRKAAQQPWAGPDRRRSGGTIG